MNIFDKTIEFAQRNYFVDVEDKIPIFLCSIGGHIFNALNKCSRCDFDPDSPLVDENNDFVIENCPLRHDNMPFYTPMSQLPDTRIHILMRGAKGSGKSVLILMFLAEGTGLAYSGNSDLGEGFRTMMGANSITEAGMFGSVDDEGEIAGRPIAREMCGGFLGFEEFSSMSDASKKDHSMDMKNQLLTSLDNGRVQKAMRNGWVRYTTRYTVWAGTQPARFELDSGLDRRFFIIDIEMTPQKERQYKLAQHKQANMSNEERVSLANLNIEIKQWIRRRMEEAVRNPPTGIIFDDDIMEWIDRPDVRSFEADLFRRMCIGYAMMQPTYRGGEPLIIKLDDKLEAILNQSLAQRRRVMDADLELMRSTFWMKDVPKSQLLKEISRMITSGDYQTAKRWLIENLEGQHWYTEVEPSVKRRGRKGVICRFGPVSEESEQIHWGVVGEK
tara:strand:- start:45 stop:1376 length:1332 start_codon:yes stop_codon:yes gene_type:complete